MAQYIPLRNDELGVVCDLLWFVTTKGGLSAVAEGLWDRLQTIRYVDYGGAASTKLSLDEARAVAGPSEFTQQRVPLDRDETALVSRLHALPK